MVSSGVNWRKPMAALSASSTVTMRSPKCRACSSTVGAAVLDENSVESMRLLRPDSKAVAIQMPLRVCQ